MVGLMQIKTIGYRFQVSNDKVSFDLISKTTITLEESKQKIEDFFLTFKILKCERITEPEIKPEPEPEPEKEIIKPVKIARPQTESYSTKWGVIREYLNEEFSRKEYVQALRDAGYEYTLKSWETVPTTQLSKLKVLNKIIEIKGSKPKMYKKVKVPVTLKDNKEKDKLVNSLRKDKRIILETFL